MVSFIIALTSKLNTWVTYFLYFQLLMTLLTCMHVIDNFACYWHVHAIFIYNAWVMLFENSSKRHKTKYLLIRQLFHKMTTLSQIYLLSMILRLLLPADSNHYLHYKISFCSLHLNSLLPSEIFSLRIN